MAINFNINPYYDDFDEANNYHRILFRPGYAVQARELTQLQTQVQDQINKFGSHVFVNGSVVVGGGRSFENDLVSIKLDPTYSGSTVNIDNFVGKIITGQTSGTKAKVKLVARLTETDPITILVKFISGDAFVAGENLSTDGTTTYNAKIQSSSPFAEGMGFSVDNGVYFIDGKFVFVEAQSVIVDKYSNTSSKNIGFLVTEEVVTSDDDPTLLDRAQGSTNYSAPGADRYAVTLSLISKDLATPVTNFVEIARVVDGELVINRDKTIYSELGKELARRTYDESGDYTVKKWPIQILEHQETPADDTKFTVALDPGKGYIKGFEYETINQEFITLDRARDTEEATGLDVNVTYGNYVIVDNMFGTFVTNSTTGAYSSVEIHNVARASVTGATTKIGSARVRFVTYNGSGTIGTSAAKYKMYLFNITMDSGTFFKDAESIVIRSGSTVLAGSNIAIDSKVGATSGGDAFISGADAPGLVFPMLNQFISELKGVGSAQAEAEYTIQRTFTTVSMSSGTGSISTANGLERFIGTSGALSDTLKNENYHIVVSSITNAGATGLTVGSVVRFNTAAGRSITLSTPATGVAHQATLNINDANFAGVLTVVAGINVNTQTERTKTLSDYRIKIIGTGSAGGLNTTTGGRDSLAVSDIYDVIGIYNTGSVNPTAVTVNGTTGALTWGAVSYTDVTGNYTVDNGQRNDFYDHGSLVLTGAAPTASHYLLVVYRNFAHTGSGFLSVDSYGIPYEDIPVFIDPASGNEYNLRDCIDFRPRRDDGLTTLSGGQVPDPDLSFNCDYQYYIGRYDKIIATSDQRFIVKRGIPSVYPVVPTDDSNGMVLYILGIPPYTADIRDIEIKYIDNRRYTMRDIGRLEKRINNLEYYTQLSLLEKQAKDTSIPDASNFEKFKNGFAVDPFTSQDIFATTSWAQRRWGWWNAWFNGQNTWSQAAQNYNENSIANVANNDFNAAIDPINQELRAPFEVVFYDFDTSTLTNTVKPGDLVTLAYTETNAISQEKASTYVNINPFDVIRFLGTIELSPAFDQWVNTTTLPDVNQVVDVRVPDAADQVIDRFSGSGNAARLTRSTTTVTTNVLSSQTVNLGSRVVDVQFVPFMRSRSVVCVGRSFKPNSRLYPFMENTAIDSFCRPLTVITVEDHTGNLFSTNVGNEEVVSIRDGSTSGAVLATAQAAIYSQPQTTNTARRLLTVFNESAAITTANIGDFVVGANGGSGEIVAVTTYALGSSIVPDEYGNVAFEFQIPANTFRTGERTIRLINNSTNDMQAQDSVGETKYTAIGQVQTLETTLLTTRSVQNQRVTQREFQRVWVDPTAQSFLVDSAVYPTGFFVSSVEIYFRSKSQTVPVSCEIRRTVNGYPESVRTIPFSECILQPESVSVSNNGATPTKFTFANPIHLTPGEYAIVLLANTQEYEVFVSNMGDTDLITGQRIDKQPYAGSLFKSQNASTWEPDQNKDLKFKLNRAVFTSAGSVEFNIQEPASIQDYQTLFVKTASILPTGTTITWEAKSYNADSTFDTDWSPVNVNQDIDYTFLRRLAASSGIGGIPSLRLRANLTTSDPAVSPATDAAAVAIVAALNEINNDTTNESGTASGGNALARYISKPINLADGFDASNLCVTIDVNRPSGTDVKVYYKTLPTELTTPIADQLWQPMVLENTVPSSTNNFDFREYRFFPSGAFDAFGVPQDSPITARFNTFQIKIVLTSDTPAQTPKVRDLRIIALDS